MTTLKTTELTPDTDAHGLDIVRQHIRSLQYGVVQIVVHDGRVTQIERTERVRLEKQTHTYKI